MARSSDSKLAEQGAWLLLCDALIRRFVGLDPLQLCDGEWLTQLSLALWIEARAYAKEAQMIAALFGEK